MNSRRDFLKKVMTFSFASTIVLFSQKAFSQRRKKKGGGEDPNTCFAKPGVDGAAMINYVEDKSKVDAAAIAAANKKDIKFAQQDCANCILYRDGVCTIITSGCKKVVPEGWCPTWTHNPAVKA